MSEKQFVLNPVNNRTFPYTDNLRKKVARKELIMISAEDATKINSGVSTGECVKDDTTDETERIAVKRAVQAKELGVKPVTPPVEQPKAENTEAPDTETAKVVTKKNVEVSDLENIPDEKLDDFANKVMKISFPPASDDGGATANDHEFKRAKLQEAIAKTVTARNKRAAAASAKK